MARRRIIPSQSERVKPEAASLPPEPADSPEAAVTQWYQDRARTAVRVQSATPECSREEVRQTQR